MTDEVKEGVYCPHCKKEAILFECWNCKKTVHVKDWKENEN